MLASRSYPLVGLATRKLLGADERFNPPHHQVRKATSVATASTHPQKANELWPYAAWRAP